MSTPKNKTLVHKIYSTHTPIIQIYLCSYISCWESCKWLAKCGLCVEDCLPKCHIDTRNHISCIHNPAYIRNCTMLAQVNCRGS